MIFKKPANHVNPVKKTFKPKALSAEKCEMIFFVAGRQKPCP
jgi:hypothetical protein